MLLLLDLPYEVVYHCGLLRGPLLQTQLLLDIRRQQVLTVVPHLFVRFAVFLAYLRYFIPAALFVLAFVYLRTLFRLLQ